MPKTAYSTQFRGEFDVEQLLVKAGRSHGSEPAALTPEIRQWIAQDVICPSCGAAGGIVVASARARSTGALVAQAHFRFSTIAGASAHDPMCEFREESGKEKTDHLVDLRSTQSSMTRAVGKLVCRGIELKAFSQETMRSMRQWFLETKRAHAFTMNVSKQALNWCADLSAHSRHLNRPNFHTHEPFQPIFGDLPGFDWSLAAHQQFADANEALIQRTSHSWWSFSEKGLPSVQRLLKAFNGQTVFDVRVLASEYQRTLDLARFALGYLPQAKGSSLYATQPVPRELSAVVALCALILFVRDWDLNKAVTLFAELAAGPPALDQAAGNFIGLNPFHDFLAWDAAMVVRDIASDSYPGKPAAALIAQIESDLRRQHADRRADEA